MPETESMQAKHDPRNLGRAITSLGIEAKFLEDGKLSQFPFVERGPIVNGIIGAELESGNWTNVVAWIYAGIGKANVLYEGDLDELDERIFQVVAANPNTSQPYGVSKTGEAIEALSKKGRHDLLFRMATGIPSFDYEWFTSITEYLPDSFFEGDEGKRKKQAIQRMSVEKAINNGKYFKALGHLRKAGEDESELFNLVLKKGKKHDNRDSISIAQDIALNGNPEKKKIRLKNLIAALLTEKYDDPKKAYDLVWEHGLSLTDRQRRKMNKGLAEKLSTYDLRDIKDEKVLLMWATRHSTTEPEEAYKIMIKQSYGGKELLNAVRAGLKLKSDRYTRIMNVSNIREDLLKAVYEKSPLDLQVEIARQLKDGERMIALSRTYAQEARKKEEPREEGRNRNRMNLEQAYHLWVDGGGDLQDNFVVDLREQLIQEEFTRSYFTRSYSSLSSLSFLSRQDLPGFEQTFNTSFEQGHLGMAYKLAVDFKDEERARQSREEIASRADPREALGIFIGYDGRKDSVGVDLVLERLAREYETDPAVLKDLVSEYKKAF